MNTLTLKFLKTHEACEDGVDFVKRNKLIGFPLSMIDQVEGDYNRFVLWLKNIMPVSCEYDSNGNEIHFKDTDGFEHFIETEYYSDGQLKRIGKLKIPFFEK